MKSPLSFKYEDLILEAEKELARMEKHFPGLVLQKRLPDTIASRKIAMKKALIKHLKKTAPVRQLKLGESKP